MPLGKRYGDDELGRRSGCRELIGRIEARLAGVEDPMERVTTYLACIEDEARPMSRLCTEDMTALAATNEAYRLTVRALRRRVGDLISEGVKAGCIRPVHASR